MLQLRKKKRKMCNKNVVFDFSLGVLYTLIYAITLQFSTLTLNFYSIKNYSSDNFSLWNQICSYPVNKFRNCRHNFWAENAKFISKIEIASIDGNNFFLGVAQKLWGQMIWNSV